MKTYYYNRCSGFLFQPAVFRMFAILLLFESYYELARLASEYLQLVYFFRLSTIVA